MFALVVGILFMILFKYKHQRVDVSVAKASKADDPDGFVN